MTSTTTRLAALRQAMQQHRLDAYLIPSSDPHQSEYVAPRWDMRAWLSGFTGSAGTLIVTPDRAGLWTDSRYFLQAETQLAGTGIDLQKLNVPHAPEHQDWLAQQLPTGARLGLDGRVVALAQARALAQRLAAKGVELVTEYDLPGDIHPSRPPVPATSVFDFPASFAGESRAQKLVRIRQWLTDHQADAVLLIALDDIAWTLNVRASDVAYNPVCVSYLLVGQDYATWYLGAERVDATLLAALKNDGVAATDYAAIAPTLMALPDATRLCIDPNLLSCHFHQLLTGKALVEIESPVAAMKAIKNDTEIAHWRQAMRKDGVALLRLFRWLSATLAQRGVTEVEVAEQLAHYRSQLPDYFGESFPAIVGYEANGAIVHYHAEPDRCATLAPRGILLLDSGGQYRDGTTDITRTVALGATTPEQRRHFTLVLKGMIALSVARFPEGTGGAQLDTLARQYLWQDGLNYGHGTGHGVGFFLNVHEGPQGFAPSAVTSRGRTAFRAGMVTSNEPGFYRSGQYGIRTENLMLCVEDQRTDFGTFYRFDTLTLFPIDRQLMDFSLLTADEIAWINAYHAEVHAGISPLLADADELDWLREQCEEM